MVVVYELVDQFYVILYEGEMLFGGYVCMVVVGCNGDQLVDMGFIVFNYVNYLYLICMFQDLDVLVEKFDMSFGVMIDGGCIEYGLCSLNVLMVQK